MCPSFLSFPFRSLAKCIFSSPNVLSSGVRVVHSVLYIIPCLVFRLRFLYKTMFSQSLPRVVCNMHHVLYTLFVAIYVYTWLCEYQEGCFSRSNYSYPLRASRFIPVLFVFFVFALFFFVVVVVYLFIFFDGAVLFTLFVLCCVFSFVFFCVLRLVSSFACVNSSLLHRFSLSFIHNALLIKDKNEY